MSSFELKAADGQQHEVVGKADFLLDEGFGVAHAGEQTEVTRGGEHALAYVFFGDEEAGAGRLGTVLRAVGEQGLLARFDVRGDVDDEGGADVGVERGVENLEGAVRRAVFGGEIEAGEAGEEAGFVAQRGRGVVVGVTALPVGQDDDAGAEPAEDCGDLEAVLEGVLDVGVGQVEGFADCDLKDAGGLSGLGGAVGRGTAGAAFATREIKDAGAGAEGLLHEEGAAAGLFYVVTVRGDSEDVDLR